MKILDCTIRDGGYINEWNFRDKLIRDVYRAISDAKVDFFEIGFINKTNHQKGIWEHISNKKIKDMFGSYSGCDLGVMINYGKPTGEIPEDVKMVRVAVHKNKLADALKYAEEIKKSGYITSLQMMGYSTFTKDEQKEVKELLKNSTLDYAYIADSYGSLLPSEIEKLLTPLLKIKSLKIGFHPHNSLQLAFANTLKAMEMGIDIIDASLLGMGRGSGNMQLELLVAYLELNGNDKYNAKPLLSCIEKNFLEIRKKNQWGYQIPYMLTGLFNCHPYYARSRKKEKRTAEDVWNHLERVKKETIGFSQEILDDILDKDVNLKLTEPMFDQKKQETINKNIYLPPSAKKIINLIEKTRRLKLYKKYEPYVDRVKELKDIHIGERCFIVGTGPSLNKTRFDLIKNEIIFGVNTLFRGLKQYDIHPKYYVLGDADVFHAHHKHLLKLDTTMILSGGPGHFYLNNKGYYESIGNKNIIPIKRLGRMSINSDFSKDITKGVFSSGTVVLHCLQIAYYMGFKTAYLLGCDCDYSSSHHFDNRRTIKKEAPVMTNDAGKKRVFKGYEICKRAYEKDGRKIYNATVGGKLEVFERISLEDIKHNNK